MTTRTPREALGIVEAAARDGRLDEICGRNRVIVMGAFGSAVRGGLREPEDLDVGVLFERSTTAGERARLHVSLWSDLADLTHCELVDVVVLHGDDPVLRAEALTGTPLYERERGQFAEAQIAAVGERRDTAYLRRRNLELMAS